jgi:arylsulfatase A-like enzyme
MKRTLFAVASVLVGLATCFGAAAPPASSSYGLPRDEVVYNVEMFRGAVRKGDWKLVWRTTLPSKIELFNLAQDPYEKTNLADQNPEKVAELQKRIDGLAAEMSKSQLLTEVFKGVTRELTGRPPALPDEDAFYEQVD